MTKMKKKNFDINISGIKCDNPECNFKDETVPFSEYKKWVNKPCPECGTNLLTREDYKNCKILKRLSFLLNLIPIPEEKQKEKASIKFEMNGTGNIDISDINTYTDNE